MRLSGAQSQGKNRDFHTFLKIFLGFGLFLPVFAVICLCGAVKSAKNPGAPPSPRFCFCG
jgi:hypothetical protein